MNDCTRQIPLSFRTAVFCFLTGAVLSIPIAPFLQNLVQPFGYLPLHFYLSARGEDLYGTIIQYLYVGCFFALPIWCAVAVRKYPPLPTIGFIAFLVVLLFGLLFPAI